jgi:hypothetical protein
MHPSLRSTALALALALGGLAPARAAAQSAPPATLTRVLVLDLVVQGSAAKELGRALADVAAAEASRVGGFAVLSQGDVVAQLGVEKSRQMLGCAEDESCMLEIAGALAAERLLAGSVTLVDGTYLLSIKQVDARKARSIARAGDTLKAPTQAELADAVRRLAHEVLTGRKLDTTGVVRIEVEEPGAAVVLDGRALGLSPIEGGQRVLEGTHRITVTKPGFVTWESTVTVTAGVTVPVSATLVPVAAIEAAKTFFVEIYAGFTPLNAYAATITTRCDFNCVGNQAGVRGGFYLGRFAVEGFFTPFSAFQRNTTRRVTVDIPWVPTTATAPEYTDQTYVFTTYAGFAGSVRFLERTPITLRLAAGVARGNVTTRSGGRFPDSPPGTTGHYDHYDVVTEYWSWIAGPELRAGYRFGRGFSIDVGIAAFALHLPSTLAERGGAIQDSDVALPDGPSFKGGISWFFPVTAGVRWDL